MPDIDGLPERAWKAYVFQEVTTPLQALLEVARALARPFIGQPESDARKTTSQILDRASYLLNTIQHLASVEIEQLSAEDRRTLRHDLRGSAAYIISACEDLQESLPPEMLAPVEPLLQECHRGAMNIIKSIEGLLSAASARDVPASMRAVLDTLNARLTTAQRKSIEPGRILLVDDNAYNRELVGRMLIKLGHTVEAVDGGRAAQSRLLQAAGTTIDIILLDMIMPDMSGLDLLLWLKSTPDLWAIPVIMVSALEDDKGVWACIASGAEDYMTRPVRPELLQARIDGCLERKRLRDREQQYLARIDRLVNAIFPPAAVDEWRSFEAIRPRRHEKVGVLFLDIVGFTTWCEQRRDSPEQVVSTLQDLVVRLEKTTARFGVQKIKTIGDAFMAVAGMSGADENPAGTLLRCGQELIRDVLRHPAGWTARVGIHIGPVVTGVLGQTQFSFDVWGHTVNAAARIETCGQPGYVTLSPEAWKEVQHLADGQARAVQARGLGALTVWDVAV